MSVRTEAFRKDTIEESVEWLIEVASTLELEVIYSITIVPIVHNGEVSGWETTILWNDKNEYVR